MDPNKPKDGAELKKPKADRSKKPGKWLTSVAATLAAVTAIVTNARGIVVLLAHALVKADGVLFDGRITSLFLNRRGWLMLKFGYMLLAVATGIVAVALLWGPLLRRTQRKSGHWTVPVSLRIAVSALVALVLSAVAIGLTADGPYRIGHAHPSWEAALVCPQCAQLGTCAVRTYANNGSVNYSVDAKGEPGGPLGYARITLQAYLPDVEHGAGWVIFLPLGSDFSSFKQLRFQIRGEKSGERIGVKVKDARGVEVPVLMNDPSVLGAAGIPGRWREVSIPLEDFPQVDFGLMDNVSFFVNGRIAGTEPQTIYIGGLEWI